jgi:hypothetical protein
MGFSREYQLVEADSDQQDQIAHKILQGLPISGSATLNPLHYKSHLIKKLNRKLSLKRKINLIQPYHKLYINPMK